MKQCANCLQVGGIHDEDNYCWKCGARLRWVTPCVCGKEVSGLDKFCPNCGKETKHEQNP